MDIFQNGFHREKALWLRSHSSRGRDSHKFKQAPAVLWTNWRVLSALICTSHKFKQAPAI